MAEDFDVIRGSTVISISSSSVTLADGESQSDIGFHKNHGLLAVGG